MVHSPSVTSAVAHIRQRRQALVDEWSAAIQRICGDTADEVGLKASVEALLDRILDALPDETKASTVGNIVGRELATLACKRMEVLGHTSLFLGQQVLADLTPGHQSVLHTAFAALLGGMANGFLGETQTADLAMREQLDEARRAERRYYTTILDMVDVLIGVFDVEGHIVGFNGAAERVSGYSFDEVYGRHYTFLQAPEVHEKTEALIARLKSLTPLPRTFVPHHSVWITREGERRQIEWSTTAIFDENGVVNYMIGTGNDVTANRQMEGELAEAHRQLTQVKEAERLRLAQDLHDDAVQQLLGISYQLAEMQRRATEVGIWSPSQRLEELAPGLEVIRGDIIAVAQGLRRLISSLRPPALRELGLAEILEVYVAEWQDGVGRSGPIVNLDTVSLEGKQLPEPVATCIFKVVQEGVWNAHKHAAAANVSVSIQHMSDQVILRIKDNGLGFRIPRHMFQFAAAGRFGFIGMQERVHAVDGLLSVWSEPGQGTEVQAQIPLPGSE